MYNKLKKDLLTKLESSDRVLVELDNEIKIYIIGYNEVDNTFIASFLPCAKNSKRYYFPIEKIDSIFGENYGTET